MPHSEQCLGQCRLERLGLRPSFKKLATYDSQSNKSTMSSLRSYPRTTAKKLRKFEKKTIKSASSWFRSYSPRARSQKHHKKANSLHITKVWASTYPAFGHSIHFNLPRQISWYRIFRTRLATLRASCINKIGAAGATWWRNLTRPDLPQYFDQFFVFPFLFCVMMGNLWIIIIRLLITF